MGAAPTVSAASASLGALRAEARATAVLASRAVPPPTLQRLAFVTPFVVLALLSLSWALCVYGRDESLVSLIATHLPALGYVTLALIALAASGLARSWLGALAALAALALALVPLGGFSLPRAAPALGAEHRVLTWNVEQWSHGGARVGRAIAELSPDVFCLQEAKSYASFPGDAEWAAFAAELPGYRLIKYGEVAIGTRWPVLEEQRVVLHDELWRRPLLDVTLRTPEDGRLRVLGAHFVHTGYYGKRPEKLVASARQRLAQAERILAHLDGRHADRGHPDRPRADPAHPDPKHPDPKHVGAGTAATILCGDLNAAPNSAVLSLLQTHLHDAWRLRGLGFGMTSSARWPLRRIDYVLVRGVDLGEVRVLDRKLSDHRALIASFALAPAPAPLDGDPGPSARSVPVRERR